VRIIRTVETGIELNI